MKIVAMGRGYGKTAEMMQQVIRDPDGVLVVCSAMRRDALRSEYPQLAHLIVAANLQDLKGRRKNLYIDDIEHVISRLVGGGNDVSGISVTVEPETEPSEVTVTIDNEGFTTIRGAEVDITEGFLTVRGAA